MKAIIMRITRPNFKNMTEHQVLVTFALLSGLAFMVTSNVYAGADVTFVTSTTLLTAWIGGSYGKMAALAALGVGLAIAIVKQSLMFVAATVGIAIIAVQGPGIVSSIVSATL
jgi:conjugal transfer pilus assembly protein TraA